MATTDHVPEGRDRLRELLDAVLDDGHQRLADMAHGAHASPFHFTRQLTRGAGEPPVAMRRRVVLERASWQLRRGTSVTDAAIAAGYDSVEGFSRAYARAYGHPPSATATTGRTDHWLPAPNGIHFHPPTSLWVEEDPAPSGGEVTSLLVHHDLDDTRHLLGVAARLPEAAYRRVRLPGHGLLAWEGPDASVAEVLHNLVRAKEMWLASIEGADVPPAGPTDVDSLTARHEVVAAGWLDAVRDIDRRGAWGDRLIDALCDPPESFVLASVLAHVLTYAAARRHLVRQMLRADAAPDGGPTADDGDPINWLRARSGGAP